MDPTACDFIPSFSAPPSSQLCRCLITSEPGWATKRSKTGGVVGSLLALVFDFPDRFDFPQVGIIEAKFSPSNVKFFVLQGLSFCNQVKRIIIFHLFQSHLHPGPPITMEYFHSIIDERQPKRKL
jgi:hypothetical protein